MSIDAGSLDDGRITFGPTGDDKVTDPVCGMELSRTAAQWEVIQDGRPYYFCSETCQKKFEATPDRYIAAVSPTTNVAGSAPSG